MGASYSNDESAFNNVVSYLTSVSTDVLVANSTAVSAEDLANATCADSDAQFATTLCAAENEALHKDAANIRDTVLDPAEALAVYTKIMDGKYASAACTACKWSSVKDTPVRAMKIDEQTTGTITTAIRAKIMADLAHIISHKMINNVAASQAQLDAAHRIVGQIENLIKEEVIDSTLRVFDSKNVVKGDASYFSETVAGSVTATNIAADIIRNNPDAMTDFSELCSAEPMEHTEEAASHTWIVIAAIIVMCILLGLLGSRLLPKRSSRVRQRTGPRNYTTKATPQSLEIRWR